MRKGWSESDIEILVATQNKVNLEFLSIMFPFKHFSMFNILVINQSQSTLLKSDYENVRILNTNDSGLSKSRNLAIKNAKKKICIFTDDDVVFFLDFEKEIINTFNDLKDASIITFNHQRIGQSKPKHTSMISYVHTSKTIASVSSVEIVFKIEDILKNELQFDEYFGLGSYFEIAEEFLFLKESLQKGLKLYYSPQVLLSHPLISSGNDFGKPKLVYSRAALQYKLKGVGSYLWLMKYILFLKQNKYVSWSQIISTYKTGCAGINQYKKLMIEKMA